MSDEKCACGSGLNYSQCCGQYIEQGLPAPTPEALMRSRFSAYALKKTPYVLSSWHPDTRPGDDLELEEDRQWIKLEVESSKADGQWGEVQFTAWCLIKGETGVLREKSRFEQIDGHWYYLDGKTLAPKAAVKVGRNDPCPCGSGKKYKKCCGKI